MVNPMSILILLLCMLTLISCEKGLIIREEIEYVEKPHSPCVAAIAPIFHPGEMLYGRVAGLKNCLPFTASARLNFYDPPNGPIITGLVISTFEDWGNFFAPKESIILGCNASGKGKYSYYIPSAGEYGASYSTLQDSDVHEDIFDIDTSYHDNEIIYEILDPVGGYASGYFNCRFLLSQNSPSGNNPDTVVFEHCYFEAIK